MDSSSSPTNLYCAMATIMPILAAIGTILWKYWSTIKRAVFPDAVGSAGNAGNDLRNGKFGFAVPSREKSSDSKDIMGNKVNCKSSGDRGPALYMHETFKDATTGSEDNSVGDENDDDERGLVDPSDNDIPNSCIDHERKPRRGSKVGINDIPITDDLYLPKMQELAAKLEQSELDVKSIDSMPGKFKKSKFVALNKQVEESMTDEQKEEEAEVRRRQLEDIFKLMKEQEERLGIQSEEDLSEQLKLYAL